MRKGRFGGGSGLGDSQDMYGGVNLARRAKMTVPWQQGTLIRGWKWHFGDAGGSERDWRCRNAQGDYPSAVGRLGLHKAAAFAMLTLDR